MTRWAVDDPVGGGDRRLRLTLVRHGESQWNRQRRAQGQRGPGLTELGRSQAARTAARLVTLPKPDLVLASDLPRVVETARPYPAEPVPEPRLRELDSGAWAGLLLTDVEREWAGDIARIRAGEDLPRGGGERFADLRRRVAALLADLARQVPAGAERRVLAFTHGGPIRALVAEVLGLGADGHRLLADPGNCSLTEVLLYVGDGTITAGRLVRYGTDDHLAPASPNAGQPAPAVRAAAQRTAAAGPNAVQPAPAQPDPVEGDA